MDNVKLVARDLWNLAGLPTDALRHLEFTGESPLLPTSFHVALAAQATIGTAALAAAEIGGLRGAHPGRVTVDKHDAERECTGYFTLNGHMPDIWAPLSGLYPCADGHVRIHANFDHHRDGALRLLGINKDPASVSKEQITAALACWDAIAFETAAADAGLVVAAARTFREWDQHPQAAAIREQPLISMTRIGSAKPIDNGRVPSAALPLSGVRVLDLTRILAGPVCGRTLAAYGADVMLVNSPNLPNIEAIAETSRGKRSVLLDLKTSDGPDLLRNLVADAHVFIQGYRPGGLAALAFGADDLAEMRPGIVVVSLSAYGNQGPWATRKGFDSLVQTATGFNHAEGEAAGVARLQALPVQILDYASGFLMTFGALAALRHQMTEGGSWHVEVSLAQTAWWLRQLGRIDWSFSSADLAFKAHALDYPSGFVAMTAMPHAAGFSRVTPAWKIPSELPGRHPPVW